MFLGTPKAWWIAVGIVFLIGLGLLATGYGETLGSVIGVLLIFGALITFAAAPMRYGRAPTKPAGSSPPPAVPVQAAPPGPRPSIEARDATEV
jgi:drug/metabolite transporter (DMT)-like permease